MENYLDPPPVWTRYDSTANIEMRNFCNMDWTNVGPVVNTYEASRCTGTTSVSQECTSRSESVLCRNKNISRKFPLEKALEFMYPVTKPKFFYLYDSTRESNYYLWSRGNCLETFHIHGKTFLLYPNYSKIKADIVVSEIKSTFTSKSGEQNCRLLCTLDTVSKLPAGRTFHMKRIIAKEVNGERYVVARSKSVVMVYVLDENLAVKSKYNLPFGSGTLLTDIAVCETIPGCFAAVTAVGEVSLRENPYKQPVWKCQFKEDQKSKNLYQCEFGRHVFPSLIVNSKSAVWSCDTRCNYKTLTSSSDETVLALKDMAFYIPATDIIYSVARSGWSQLYIVTSSCVVLADERYCKTPVMKWHHMMQDQPLFSSVTRLKDREVLMLGSNENSKVCAITHEWSNRRINTQCFSGMPRHFDVVRDTAEFAYRQGIWFRHHVDRLDNPLAGFASCSHPEKDNLLHLFTLNIAGDIFLQVFHNGNPDVDVCTECHNTKDNNQYGKRVLKEWEETVIEEMMKNYKVKGTTYDLQSCYDDLEKSVTAKGRSLNGEGKFWNVKQYVINKSLGSTKLSLFNIEENSPRKSNTGVSLEKFIPDHLFRGVEMALQNRCNDELSCKILALWKSKTMEETTFSYKRAPFNVDRLSQPPKKLKIDKASSMDQSYFEESTMDSFISQSDAGTEISQSSTQNCDYVTRSMYFPSTPMSKKKKKQNQTNKQKIDGF